MIKKRLFCGWCYSFGGPRIKQRKTTMAKRKGGKKKGCK